jgi:ribonuclease R
MSRRNDRAPREPREYSVVIPSREDIAAALDKADAPLPLPALANLLGLLGNDEAVDGLTRRLRAMVRDGQLVENRAGRYGVAKRMELIAGRVIGHPDGFAFVRPDTGEQDIYLEPRQARRVLHDDRVLVRIAGLDQRDRPFGAIVEVISRANSTLASLGLRPASTSALSAAIAASERKLSSVYQRHMSVSLMDRTLANIVFAGSVMPM